MLLLVDIGNTNTTIALCENDRVRHMLRTETDIQTGSEECGRTLSNFVMEKQVDTPEGAVICSVVPAMTPVFLTTVKSSFSIDPLIVSHDMNTGLEFQIHNIEGLGADRIAAAAAARTLYKGDLIVIDFGTATTFCVITADNKYRGGAIMPGPGLCADVLNEKTAMLPRVDLSPPADVIGKDTSENICSGIILGHAGAVERIISEIKKAIGRDVTVVATGGYLNLMKPYIKVDYIEPELIFKGMSIIYEMNSN